VPNYSRTAGLKQSVNPLIQALPIRRLLQIGGLLLLVFSVAGSNRYNPTCLVLTHHLTMTGPGSIANEADLCFNNFTVSKRQAQSRSAKTQQSSRTYCEIVFGQWFSRNGLSAIDCIIARILIFVKRIRFQVQMMSCAPVMAENPIRLHNHCQRFLGLTSAVGFSALQQFFPLSW
jgi:hypothetical protein